MQKRKISLTFLIVQCERHAEFTKGPFVSNVGFAIAQCKRILLNAHSLLSCSEQPVKDWAKQSDPVDVMGVLRDSKDKFVIGSR